MPKKEYQRLTRARPRARFAVISAGSTSLWLGKDHLLSIDSTGYTESYKRFYFRDIQAFFLRKTEGQKWVGLILAVLVGLFFFPAALGEGPVRIVFGTGAAIFALAFLLNLALGPACSCQLRTAVQVEELPSLVRIRRARKILERLRPLISAAQGELRREDIPLRFQEWSHGPVASSAAIPRSVVEDPNAPPRTI